MGHADANASHNACDNAIAHPNGLNAIGETEDHHSCPVKGKI